MHQKNTIFNSGDAATVMTPTNHDDSVDLMREQRYQNNRSNLSKSPDTAQARN